MSSYREKLKDVKWQKKRLEILQLHGWRCDYCRRGENDSVTLDVHHPYYDRLDPWDYPTDVYQVLCNGQCHNFVQASQICLYQSFARIGVHGILAFAAKVETSIKINGSDATLGYLMNALVFPLREVTLERQKSFEEQRARIIAQLDEIAKREGSHA